MNELKKENELTIEVRINLNDKDKLLLELLDIPRTEEQVKKWIIEKYGDVTHVVNQLNYTIDILGSILDREYDIHYLYTPGLYTQGEESCICYTIVGINVELLKIKLDNEES